MQCGCPDRRASPQSRSPANRVIYYPDWFDFDRTRGQPYRHGRNRSEWETMAGIRFEIPAGLRSASTTPGAAGAVSGFWGCEDSSGSCAGNTSRAAANWREVTPVPIFGRMLWAIPEGRGAAGRGANGGRFRFPWCSRKRLRSRAVKTMKTTDITRVQVLWYLLGLIVAHCSPSSPIVAHRETLLPIVAHAP